MAKTADTAIEAMKKGAFDYLYKPVDLQQRPPAFWRRPAGLRAELRDGGQQHARVAGMRIGEDVPHGPVFEHSPAAHDDDPVGDLRHHAHVVGDEQDSGAGLAPQVAQQVQDAGLHRHVERGGRLVGDQQLGPAGQRHRDHDPLPHPAREGMRMVAEAGGGVGDADEVEQPPRLRQRRGAAGLQVVAQRLGDLEADREHRVEAGERLLEDHAGRAAAQAAHPPLRQLEHVVPVQHDPAGHGGVARQQAHDRQRGDALAGAGLADQRRDLAGRHGE